MALIETSLGFINELVSNNLDLNKFEAGMVELHPTVVSVRRDVIDSVVTMLGIANGPVRVLAECEGPIWIKADALRLKQLVMNLAKNSVKFTEAGFVRICAWTNTDMLHLAVEDTGPGISDPSKVFRKYEQLNNHIQGTGIGLALCEQIVDSMDGVIAIDQSYCNVSGVGGIGTRVVVSMPVVRPMSISEDAAQGTRLSTIEHFIPKGLRVLVVDDDDAVRTVLVRRLHTIMSHPRIEEASTGEQALSCTASAAREGLPFQLVTMDHYMATAGGRFTGTEAIRALRVSGYTGALVGCSANDNLAEHMDAGADAFFRKPLPDKETMVATLSMILRRTMFCGQWKVLVVDDDDALRQMWKRRLSHALTNASFNLAANGHAALNALRSTEDFDLVLIDENLGPNSPKGTTVVSKFREERPDAQTIVVGISAAPMKCEHLGSGCDASWDKCCLLSVPEIRARLQQLRLGSRLSTSMPSVSVDERCVPDSEMTTVLNGLLSSMGPEVVSELAPFVLKSWPAYVRNLLDALAANDSILVKQHSHKLKGSLTILDDKAINRAMTEAHARAEAGVATAETFETVFEHIERVITAFTAMT